MNIEEFRDFCLSMDGVSEKTPFGKFSTRFDSTLVFYVNGHMFCMADMDNFSSVTLRSTPEEIVDMKTHYFSVHNPLNRALKFWVRICLNEDMSDSDIYSKMKRAYEIIKNKNTKRRK